jgi:hypothetical protein
MYGLKVEKFLYVIVSGFEETYGIPFKAIADIPTIRSFKRQLQDVFDKVVKSDPIHTKLADLLRKLVKNLGNYYVPRTQFSAASNFNSKMNTDQLIQCLVEYRQQFFDICAQFKQLDLNLLSENEW